MWKEPATIKQKDFIRNLGFPYPEIVDKMTKIQANKVINNLLRFHKGTKNREKYLMTFTSPIIPNGIAVYYTDGGTINNGHTDQYSVFCVVKNDKVILEKDIGNATNNEAEFTAVIETLKLIPTVEKAVIYCDSKLVVNSLNSEWNLKVGRLIHLKNIIEKLWDKNRVKIEWIRRFHNKAGEVLERKYNV